MSEKIDYLLKSERIHLAFRGKLLYLSKVKTSAIAHISYSLEQKSGLLLVPAAQVGSLILLSSELEIDSVGQVMFRNV